MPDFQFSFKAYAHQLVNPPNPQLGSDVELTLTNRANAFDIKKGARTSQTEYDVSILDPARLGIEDDSQLTVLRACQDLVLGCNMLLTDAVLSVSKFEPSKPQVTYLPKEVRVEEAGGSPHFFASVGIRTEVSFVVGNKEDLDESAVVALLHRIKTQQRFTMGSDSSPRRTALVNSLHEFEGAMGSFDRLFIFKHLYNSLELSANADGTDRSGGTLDSRMLTVIQSSGVPATISQRADAAMISKWRELNNATKHIHSSESDVATFVSGVGNLPTYIELIRPSSAKALLGLLQTAP